jgi:hypothetical protein
MAAPQFLSPRLILVLLVPTAWTATLATPDTIPVAATGTCFLVASEANVVRLLLLLPTLRSQTAHALLETLVLGFLLVKLVKI